MDKRYVLSQVMKTVFQGLLYISLFLTFFLLLSITNPQIITMSRTAATTMATFAILLFILTMVYGGYQIGVKKARSVFSSILIAILMTDIATYLQLQIMNVNPANNDRLILFGDDFWLFLLAMAIQVGLVYAFVWLGYRFYFKINPPQKCCVVASSQEQAEHIAEKVATFRQKYKLYDVVHYACADVQETILAHDVVFLAGIPDTEEAQLKSFCYKYGKTIYLLAELEDVIISTSQQSVIDDTLFLYMHRVEPTLIQRFIKRAMDIVISLIGLVVGSPLMLCAAIAIKLTSPGTLFFKQERATIGGKVFRIVKFRTMYRNACDTRAQSACVNDERITPVGRFLRKYRIDELPQLLNVLKGDMSIVGPRPEMLENVDRYTQEVPEFEYRKQMKAGLTGMAQIDGKYNTTPKDKVILDLLYIENFSLMMDIKLIMRTATIFFRRDSTEGFQTGRKARCPALRTQPIHPMVAEGTTHMNQTMPEDGTEGGIAIVTPTGDTIQVTRENRAKEIIMDASDLKRQEDASSPPETQPNQPAPEDECATKGVCAIGSHAPAGMALDPSLLDGQPTEPAPEDECATKGVCAIGGHAPAGMALDPALLDTGSPSAATGQESTEHQKLDPELLSGANAAL
ncbi:MAG: sugar transferase [Candidatus Limiplasma sp.]|nr:sugar transferase [Candidatus Limiplasma sp.]